MKLKEILSIIETIDNPTVGQINTLLSHVGLTVASTESVDDLVTQVNHFAVKVNAQEKIIQKQQSQLAVKDNEIRRLQDTIQNTGVASVSVLRTQLQHKDEALNRQKEKIKKLGNEIFNLNQTACLKNQYKQQLEEVKEYNNTLHIANEILRQELLKVNEQFSKMISLHNTEANQLKNTSLFSFPEHEYNDALFSDRIRVHDIVEIKDGSYSVCLRHGKSVLDTSVHGIDKDEWLVIAINVNCPNTVESFTDTLRKSNNCILKNKKGDVLFASSINLVNKKMRMGNEEIYPKYTRFQ